MSIVYTSYYELTDKQTENEKLLFSEIINERLNGKILDAGYTLQSLMYVTLNEPDSNFKEFGKYINFNKNCLFYKYKKQVLFF